MLRAKIWKSFNAPKIWTAVVQAHTLNIVALFRDNGDAQDWLTEHADGAYEVVEMEIDSL